MFVKAHAPVVVDAPVGIKVELAVVGKIGISVDVAVANGEAVQRCSAEIQIALSRERRVTPFTATIADRKLTGGGAKE